MAWGKQCRRGPRPGRVLRDLPTQWEEGKDARRMLVIGERVLLVRWAQWEGGVGGVGTC